MLFLIPGVAQFINRTEAIWLKVKRIALIALIDKIFQRFTGVPGKVSKYGEPNAIVRKLL